MIIQRLLPEHAEVYLTLRHEMLHDSPLSFLASPGTDVAGDIQRLRERLEQGDANATFGAFDPNLVGAVGVFREHHPKAAHKANVWGMYVSPDARRQGFARRLVEAAISHARTLKGVTQVNLSVSDTAPGARDLYESMGFRVWGCEPRALAHEGIVCDEHHMVLFLEPGATL